MDFIHQIEPFLNDGEAEATKKYLESGGWLTEFKENEAFSAEIARIFETKHVITLTSGTVALYLALKAAGVGPGDKVLVPNYTMVATPNVVKWCGAEVVLVDVEPGNLGLDLKKVDPSINPKAVLYASMNGRSIEMGPLLDYCRSKNAVLIEDACQAMGSKFKGKYIGTFGAMSAFSFTPHKLVTTGQGGCVLTNDDAYATAVKKQKDFSRTQPGKDEHDGIGFNFKFTDIQAVIGRRQLLSFEWRRKKKQQIFKKYSEILKEVPEVTLTTNNDPEFVPWFMDILLPSMKDRDQLIPYLKERSVGSRPFYPPINSQLPYRDQKGDFTVSSDVAWRGLWLPSSFSLNDEKIFHVCSQIASYFGRKIG